jgi:hypothetical protein
MFRSLVPITRIQISPLLLDTRLKVGLGVDGTTSSGCGWSVMFVLFLHWFLFRYLAFVFVLPHAILPPSES